jgi:hypothetical protein
MFFIGITGQLITLILTVFLPFVFLVSSQSKTVFPEKTGQSEVLKNLQPVNSGKINSTKIDFSFSANLQKLKIGIEKTFIQKNTLPKVLVKLKSFYSKSSGNKAPPVICCFSC